MHFHLPKPLHGWREFVGEIVIIVIGVLIALGAEQVVERWIWAEKVDAAERMMKEEIKDSLLAATEIIHLEKCSHVQAEALHNAVLRSDQFKAQKIMGSDTWGVGRQWADNAFQATLAAQVSDHLGAEKLKKYSQTYELIRRIKKLQEGGPSPESALLISDPELPSTPERRYAQLREMAVAKLTKLRSHQWAAFLIRFTKKSLGLEVSEREYLAAPGRAEVIKRCEAGAAVVTL